MLMRRHCEGWFLAVLFARNQPEAISLPLQTGDCFVGFQTSEKHLGLEPSSHTVPVSYRE